MVAWFDKLKIQRVRLTASDPHELVGNRVEDKTSDSGRKTLIIRIALSFGIHFLIQTAAIYINLFIKRNL